MSRRLAYENQRLYEYDYKPVGIIFRRWQEHRITNPHRMIFPQNGFRAFYQVGDCIFTRDWPRNEAARRYQEFAVRLNSEFSWGSFILFLLDTSNIKITQQIVAINAFRDTFSVTFRSLLIISDNERLLLHYIGGHETQTISERQLNDTYLWTGLIHSTRAIRPAGEAMLDIITLPIGGVARTGAKRLLVPLMRRHGKRIFLRLFAGAGKERVKNFVRSKMFQKVGIFFAKLARDTVQNIVTTYRRELIVNRDRQAVDPATVQNLRLEIILANAFRDAVAANVTGEIKSGIGKLVPDEAADAIFDVGVAERITAYMAKTMLEQAVHPLNSILKSSIEAISFDGDESTYRRRLTEDVDKKFRQRYTGGIFADLVSSALNDILETPELVF